MSIDPDFIVTITEWSRYLGISSSAIDYRLNKGTDEDRIFFAGSLRNFVRGADHGI